MSIRKQDAFDLRVLIDRWQDLVGAHVKKPSVPRPGVLLLRLNLPGAGSDRLYFQAGKAIYRGGPPLPAEGPPAGFPQLLRKHIDGQRISAIRQVGFDRVLEIQFRDLVLVLELFGKGNAILYDEERLILGVWREKSWRDRELRPRHPYLLPRGPRDPWKVGVDEWPAEPPEDPARWLTRELGLPPKYAHALVRQAGGLPSPSRLQEFLSEPDILHENGPDHAWRRLGDGWEASDRDPDTLFVLAVDTTPPPDPRVTRLQRQLIKQEETLERYRQEVVLVEAQAELLWLRYQEVAELLAGTSTREKVSVDLGDAGTITLQGGLTFEQSLDIIYQRVKDRKRRILGAEQAILRTRKDLASKTPTKDEHPDILHPKQYWWSRFRWFRAPSGHLVLAGRDARSNERLVKRHLKDDDLYAHADIHGAASVVIKAEGSEVPEETLKLACRFAWCMSKGWSAGIAAGSAFWVRADQVSKTPQSGEFLAKGSFMVRGRRTMITHIQSEIHLGIISDHDDLQLMIAPQEAFPAGTKLIKLIPDDDRTDRIAKEVAEKLNVDLETVRRTLPPGGSRVG